MAGVVLLTLLAVAGCTRPNSTGAAGRATPIQVFTAGPTVSDIRTILGDDQWWPGTPSFGVRPLDLEMTPEDVRFTITQRYVRIGSGDTMSVQYGVYASVSTATTFVNNQQTALGTNVATTPKVGDQVLYTGQKLATATALYESDALVRVGQIVIAAAIKQGSGFVAVAELAKVAGKIVSRLKDVLANKVRPSPLASGDDNLLPAPGTDLTMIGVARLPIEVVADMLNAASPEQFTSAFTSLGVSDFLFGDYALNADLHMEVRTATITFSSAADAGAWIDAVVGKSNLDANGVFLNYLDALKQYILVFVTGDHVGLALCKSTLDTEAASRACEVPMERMVGPWLTRLT